MVLTADKRTAKIALEGAPAGANLELSIQDTSRGSTKTLTLRTDANGVATAGFPDFDFAKSVHVIVNDKIYRLTFDAEQPTDGTMRLSDGTAAMPAPPEAKQTADLVSAWLESESQSTTVVGE